MSHRSGRRFIDKAHQIVRQHVQESRQMMDAQHEKAWVAPMEDLPDRAGAFRRWVRVELGTDPDRAVGKPKREQLPL